MDQSGKSSDRHSKKDPFFRINYDQIQECFEVFFGKIIIGIKFIRSAD